MSKVKPKYRKSLNDNQVAVLKLLYKFRFATTKDIATYQHIKHHRVVQAKLSILLEQDYIGRQYDSSYKLAGKQAIYFLLPKGMKTLKTLPDFHTNSLTSMYKDKQASEQFMTHCLSVFTICNQLKSLYGDRLQFVSRSELARYSYFIRPLPDAYIALKTPKDKRRFLVEVFEDSKPIFVLNRRIKQYIQYYEEGDWDDTDTDFPAILMICESASQQKQIHKKLDYNLYNASLDEEDIVFATTIKPRLLVATKTDAIWQTPEGERPFRLTTLP